jgi:hypothetical protein
LLLYLRSKVVWFQEQIRDVNTKCLRETSHLPEARLGDAFQPVSYRLMCQVGQPGHSPERESVHLLEPDDISAKPL